MTDYVLCERLEVYDAQLDQVYKNSAGYVHLSDKMFYSSVTTSSLEQYDIEVSVRQPLKEKANPALLQVAKIFIHYVQLQNNIINQVIISRISEQ